MCCGASHKVFHTFIPHDFKLVCDNLFSVMVYKIIFLSVSILSLSQSLTRHPDRLSRSEMNSTDLEAAVQWKGFKQKDTTKKHLDDLHSFLTHSLSLRAMTWKPQVCVRHPAVETTYYLLLLLSHWSTWKYHFNLWTNPMLTWPRLCFDRPLPHCRSVSL